MNVQDSDCFSKVQENSTLFYFCQSILIFNSSFYVQYPVFMFRCLSKEDTYTTLNGKFQLNPGRLLLSLSYALNTCENVKLKIVTHGILIYQFLMKHLESHA